MAHVTFFFSQFQKKSESCCRWETHSALIAKSREITTAAMNTLRENRVVKVGADDILGYLGFAAAQASALTDTHVVRKKITRDNVHPESQSFTQIFNFSSIIKVFVQLSRSKKINQPKLCT